MAETKPESQLRVSFTSTSSVGSDGDEQLHAARFEVVSPDITLDIVVGFDENTKNQWVELVHAVDSKRAYRLELSEQNGLTAVFYDEESDCLAFELVKFDDHLRDSSMTATLARGNCLAALHSAMAWLAENA
jgi:hypothetical protein